MSRKGFCFLYNVQTGSGAHPAPTSNYYRPGGGGGGAYRPASKLMHVALSPLHIHGLVLKQQDDFTWLYLPVPVVFLTYVEWSVLAKSRGHDVKFFTDCACSK